MNRKIIYVDAKAQDDEGNATWQPTGITLREGQDIAVVAVGYAAIQNPIKYYLDPAGKEKAYGPNGLAPDLGSYSLIGKVGDGTPVQIGTSWVGDFDNGGELLLGYNDSIASDNAGGFMVTVTW